ncbi:uncharacterized protein LOC144981320 isoform X3 [Oryzias latipes]
MVFCLDVCELLCTERTIHADVWSYGDEDGGVIVEFISERLAAAAEEIFRHCEGTIVQYEQELCRQRRLLDITRNPRLQLHAIGGPKFQRSVVVEEPQLDGDACQEAMSLLNHATDTTLIFRKMRETFQHRQKLVNDSDKALDILSIFPRFLDTKGLQWDPIFRCNIIKEAKQLT